MSVAEQAMAYWWRCLLGIAALSANLPDRYTRHETCLLMSEKKTLKLQVVDQSGATEASRS